MFVMFVKRELENLKERTMKAHAVKTPKGTTPKDDMKMPRCSKIVITTTIIAINHVIISTSWKGRGRGVIGL
jgi:hypothetical protein